MSNINFTQAAIDQVGSILQSDMIPSDTVAIRVFVSGGGCSGFQYGFEPASSEQINNEDIVFDFEAAKFVVDPLSVMYLENAIVDYKQDVMTQQFTITNPNVVGECGCGNSFTV